MVVVLLNATDSKKTKLGTGELKWSLQKQESKAIHAQLKKGKTRSHYNTNSTTY